MANEMSRDRVWNQKTSYGYIVSDKTQILVKIKIFPKTEPPVFTKKVLEDFSFLFY